MSERLKSCTFSVKVVILAKRAALRSREERVYNLVAGEARECRSDYVSTLLFQTIVVKFDYVQKRVQKLSLPYFTCNKYFFSNSQCLLAVFTTALLVPFH